MSSSSLAVLAGVQRVHKALVTPVQCGSWSGLAPYGGADPASQFAIGDVCRQPDQAGSKKDFLNIVKATTSLQALEEAGVSSVGTTVPKVGKNLAPVAVTAMRNEHGHIVAVSGMGSAANLFAPRPVVVASDGKGVRAPSASLAVDGAKAALAATAPPAGSRTLAALTPFGQTMPLPAPPAPLPRGVARGALAAAACSGCAW